MTIKTWFDLGAEAWTISAMDVQRKVHCVTCERSGSVTIGDETFVCPKCHGRARTPQDAGKRWTIAAHGFVGKVVVELYIDRGAWFAQREKQRDDGAVVGYMLDSTGIGGGTVWQEADCYPSRADAQAECDRRNAAILPDDPE